MTEYLNVFETARKNLLGKNSHVRRVTDPAIIIIIISTKEEYRVKSNQVCARMEILIYILAQT
jgi:hypothetical protein